MIRRIKRVILALFCMVLLNTVNAQVFSKSADGFPLGTYTRDQVKSDFNTTWGNGFKKNNGSGEDRVAVVNSPNGESGRCLRVKYPKNKHDSKDSGAQWETDLGAGYTDLYLSYDVRFGPNFDLSKNGKLPGLGGGLNKDDDDDDNTAWDGKLQFRSGGKMEFYVKQPITNEKHFGWFNSFTLQKEKWYNFEIRYKLNTPGSNNGIMQAWVDGVLVGEYTNFGLFRNNNNVKIYKMFFSTFYGGNESDEPSNDNYTWFDNIIVSTSRIGNGGGAGSGGGPTDNGPDGYTFATNEGGTVNVNGTVDIAYGANGQYVYLTNQTSNVVCNNSAFGGDPVIGVSKKCYTKVVTTNPNPSGGINICTTNASSSQSPNVPPNVIDGNLSTRWSSNGIGETLVLDLCDNYVITDLKMAFFKGNSRSTNFDIQVSTDNSNWTNVLTEVSSSGNSLELEDFDVTDTTARYLRYVGRGNTSNNWNSVTEIEVYGAADSSPTTDGGTVVTNSGDTLVATITGDGLADVVNFSNTSSSSENYIYLITDEVGNILTTETSAHDFEGASVGVCLVYGLSYTGSLSVSGKNVSSGSLASGDFSISSNYIEVIRESNTTTPITIESVDDEQQPNVAENLLDGNTADNSRWSAQNFSKSVVFDLGSQKAITGFNMWTYQDRAYKYEVKISNSPNTGFNTRIVDRRNNTSGSQPISNNFSAATARYVQLTITGAHNYGGSWVSINEVEIETSDSSSRAASTENIKLRVFPNPSNDGVFNLSKSNVWSVSSVVGGRMIAKGQGTLVDLSRFDKGIYILRVGKSTYLISY